MELEDHRTRNLSSGKDLHLKISQLIRGTHLQMNNEQERDDDLLSHWMLCVAFSMTEELRRRFQLFESDLFTYRFSQLSASEIRRFVVDAELGYEQVSDLERDQLLMTLPTYGMFNPLEDVFKSKDPAANFSKAQFYKVSFTQVCDLVRSRKVFLSKGTAYISQNDLISAFLSNFRSLLQVKLETAARSLSWSSKDDRLGPLIYKLQNASLGTDLSNTSVSSKAGEVKLEDLPALAKRSFPLCGRHLEISLTREHHLKYDARLQYVLFLKGIGLSLEDCVSYFQREFGKKGTTSDEFRKKGYLYQIRHSYGQEGKRANYTPWSCSKALHNRPTAKDQRHGCPFQEFTPDRLTQCVKDTGVPEIQVKRIVELVKTHDYQIACRLHWELLHPKGNAEAVGNHPNAWFDESMKYFENKEKEEKLLQSSETASSIRDSHSQLSTS